MKRQTKKYTFILEHFLTIHNYITIYCGCLCNIIHVFHYYVAGFSVLGDLLSVVRIKRDMRPPLNETDLMARLNTVDEQSALSALMVHTLDRFISSHILRITLPSGITAALKGNARSMFGNTLDINLSRAIGEGNQLV